MKHRSLIKVFGSMKPIGMYRRRSDDTFGMTTKLLFGMFSTWNLVGLAASFRVGALLLAKRNLRTASTRFITSGICRSSFGSQSPSHRHHRSQPLRNSAEPSQRRNHFFDFGSLRMNSSRSSAVNR